MFPRKQGETSGFILPRTVPMVMASCAFLWVREPLYHVETAGIFPSSSPGSSLCLSPALFHKRGPVQMTSVSSAHRESQQELRWRRARSEHSLDSLLPQVVTWA